MAWEEKYRLEYHDIWGIQWIVKFNFEDYSGGITYFQGSGEAIQFEFLNDSDNIYAPLKPSRAIFSVISSSVFSLVEFCSTEQMQIWVEVYQGDASDGDLYWCGWVDPKDFTEPYEPGNQVVQINCIDGLTLLADMVYAEQDSALDTEYYTGRRLESQIVLDILAKIGHTEFAEYINLYEEEMLATTDDSPFDQTKIDTEVFEEKNCDEVLINILSKYNACIRLFHPSGQTTCRFNIYRPNEIISSTVYGRIFTASTTKTSTSYSADQYINRTGHNTNLKQIPGGDKVNIAPLNKVIVNQDYGYRESWIKNWKFEGSRWNNVLTLSNYFPDEWTRAGFSTVSGIAPIYPLIPGESDGLIFNEFNVGAGLTHYITQTFASDAIADVDDVFGFEFEYQWVNLGSATSVGRFFNVKVETVDGGHILEEVGDDTTLQWNLSDMIAIEADVPAGLSGWITYKRSFISLPHTSQYKITVYSPNDADVDTTAAIKNIKFYGSTDKVVLKTKKRKLRERLSFGGGIGWGEGTFSLKRKYYTVKVINDLEEIVEHQYIVTNPINGDNLDLDYILGDVTDSGIANILEQFKGSLAVVLRDTLTQAAADFVTDHSGEYPGITVTSSGADIIFTEADGNDFTGATSIANATGNLSGTVATIPPKHIDHVTAEAQVDTIIVAGSSGHAHFTIGGTSGILTFVDTIENMIDTFIAASGATFSANEGVTIAKVEINVFTATANVAGTPFTSSKEETGITLDIDTTSANVEGVSRVDTITLTGIDGTANIVCDAVTANDVEIDETIQPSAAWRPRTEASSGFEKPLLELTGDEVANQFSRPVQLVTIPIQETSGETTLNLIGNLQDDLNQLNSVNRKFVINRGMFKARSREWDIDLMEAVE